jgi:DNA replication and repair protein RecF
VAAHLDAYRRAALFERLALLGGQTWMTGTDAELFAPISGSATRIVFVGGRPLIDQGC